MAQSALLHSANAGLTGAEILQNEYDLLHARYEANEALIADLDEQLKSVVDHRVRGILSQMRSQLQDNLRQSQPLLETIAAELAE